MNLFVKRKGLFDLRCLLKEFVAEFAVFVSVAGDGGTLQHTRT